MTEYEYEILKSRLRDKYLHHNPFDPFAREGNAYRAFGYDLGVRDAISIIYDFYQQFGEGLQEVNK